MMTNWRLISSSTLGHNKMCSALNILFPTGPDQTITTLSTSRFVLFSSHRHWTWALIVWLIHLKKSRKHSSSYWDCRAQFHGHPSTGLSFPAQMGGAVPHQSASHPSPSKDWTRARAREIIPHGSSFINKKATWSFQEGTSGRQQGRVLAGEPNKMQAHV